MKPSKLMAKARGFDEDTLDRMSAAYWNEFTRWAWRRAIRNGHYRFELVRSNSPKGDICDEDYNEITSLTKRACPDWHSADLWLSTYRKRAAMKAALDAM